MCKENKPEDKQKIEKFSEFYNNLIEKINEGLKVIYIVYNYLYKDLEVKRPELYYLIRPFVNGMSMNQIYNVRLLDIDEYKIIGFVLR